MTSTQSDDPVDIRNWQRRDEGITTSGKLESGDPARLAAIGVKHVINLALDNHPEALAREGELLGEHGIAYTHIPVPFDAPSRDHIAAMKAALEKVEGPAHVHCIMNYRVTGFFYALDREAGVSHKVAHALMTKVWDPFDSDDPAATPWKALLEQF